VTRAIVLAAQRAGAIDPLASRFGVTHKCMVPITGKPLIAYVIETLAAHPGIDEISVSIEAEMADEVFALSRSLDNARIRRVRACDNIADSVLAAVRGAPGPFIVTTADNALLQPEAITAMLDSLSGADVAIAMAARGSVLSVHPDAQRRFYRFADGDYSNCNLYGLAGHRALAAIEFFRGGGQFAKKAKRIVEAFGLVNLILMRTRIFTLPKAMARIGHRIGLSIQPVILADGRNAIDVDNDRTYAIVEGLLPKRAEPAATEKDFRIAA
jgi:GTP:adenosylcobinamide-phosphate guanylyltransferase